jgi:hypothetical protein
MLGYIGISGVEKHGPIVVIVGGLHYGASIYRLLLHVVLKVPGTRQVGMDGKSAFVRPLF